LSVQSPISNWVKLLPGIPIRVHFVDHAIVVRQIVDPVTKNQKSVESLQFTVDRLDGNPVSKNMSIVSERLAGEFGPFLTDKRYVKYEFVIVKDAAGPTPPRIAQSIPL
jgi:hypothetical protein